MSKAIIHTTRYALLGYVNDGPGRWRFVSLEDDSESRVGFNYRTKADLLANLHWYATKKWGYEANEL